jgi:hypothetical protein
MEGEELGKEAEKAGENLEERDRQAEFPGREMQPQALQVCPSAGPFDGKPPGGAVTIARHKLESFHTGPV